MMAHTNVKSPKLLHRMGLSKRPYTMDCDYRGDGLGTKGKSLTFMQEPVFATAWEKTARQVHEITGERAPDVRWRAHMALWAARQAMHRQGAFVECGVNSGLLSGVICHALDWNTTDRDFFLFDTWAGIPTARLTAAETKVADNYNRAYHQRDIYEGVKAAFAPFKRCQLVRGMLPDSLAEVSIDKIAYLSIDLNNATYERACIDALWPKLSSGAIVLIDDYNFASCRLQQEMWDGFAAEQSLMIAALPTGQGVLIKP